MALSAKGKSFIVVIALIVGLVVFFLVFFAGQIWDLGFKVGINGKVVGPSLVNGEWDISVISHNVEKDVTLLTTSPLLFGIGETDEARVIASINTGSSGVIKSEASIGSLGDITGETRPYSLMFRHVPAGYYYCTVEVWEIQKGWFGLYETGRSLRDSYEFELEVG